MSSVSLRNPFARGWPISGRRSVCCVGLIAGGLWFGGVPEVIAFFVAALLVAEGLIPVPVAGMGDADERFSRAVRERRRDRWLRRSRPLEVLDLDGVLASARRRDLGVEPIGIDTIVGTVEPGKTREFDGLFRPSGLCASRWKSLWVTTCRGDPVPPVSVYRVNESHWLRDGHHRVSVERARDASTIDAEVVELLL